MAEPPTGDATVTSARAPSTVATTLAAVPAAPVTGSGLVTVCSPMRR